MNPEDVRILNDVLDMLKKRGLTPSRVRLPSGLELSFGQSPAEIPEEKGSLEGDEKAERARRKARDRQLGIV